MSDPTSEKSSVEGLISARAVARRRKPFLGKALLLLAAILALATIIMATQVSWSELSEARTAMRKRMETEKPHRFLVPGKASFEFPAGRVFVSYLTDTEFEETRYLAPTELVFELVITDADGTLVDVEVEPTQRANLQSSRPGKPSAAVLVGSAVLPSDGTYSFDLILGPRESSRAVADVFVINDAEVAALETAFAPLLGFFCSGGGALFLGLLGGISVWMERRTAAALAAMQDGPNVPDPNV
ncbi:MAG: hypothetical protein P8J59_03875 [Phycisphaerales bacterium]|jgi:hypothetical protein|nr:hypothetical protein [Phycisphaerales bacterium]